MNDNNTSQSQQNDTFDPTEAWTRLSQDSVARLVALYDEVATMEAKTYERVKAASGQFADLASESITYATKLASNWRELTLSATRRGADFLRARAA